MTLYIIRHGETEYNRQGIVQGSGVDGDLNQMGRKQAHFFYRYYQHIHFDYIVTSVLKRTHQTVEPFLLRGLLETKREVSFRWRFRQKSVAKYGGIWKDIFWK